ncbi:MAG TPA: hypothetical protein DIT64_02535 [Verrucomicrobiales bacterium]|nr:hypothetical protein [Verrucomicrobiales bacterium]
MAMLKAALFDLDGTLIDSLADIAGAINEMLDGRGWPRCEVELFREMVGDGMDRLVERALPPHARTPELIQTCVEEYRANYDKRWQRETRPYEGITELLAALKARDIRLGVISNKAHRFTVPMTEHFFGADCFDIILGQRAEVPRKPDPAAGLEVVQALRLDPKDCAYVGDSGIDMEFARHAGMTGIGVTWGFRSERELRENGAHILVARPLEILKCLESAG